MSEFRRCGLCGRSMSSDDTLHVCSGDMLAAASAVTGSHTRVSQDSKGGRVAVKITKVDGTGGLGSTPQSSRDSDGVIAAVVVGAVAVAIWSQGDGE